MLALLMGAAMTVALATTVSVSGAYCGLRADTMEIQAQFLKEHAKDVHPPKLSSIMAIAAYFPGGAGQVVYQGAGMGTEYFAQTSAGWRSAGYTAPSYFPKAAVTFFNRMLDLRSNGGKECVNAKFVNVGSG